MVLIVSCIESFDLRACDAQAATMCGVHSEYIAGQCLDDLLGSYCSLVSLINSSSDTCCERNVRAVFLFDHEEVGSLSSRGAGSSIVRDTITRVIHGVIAGTGNVDVNDVVQCPGYITESLLITLQRSVFISVDNAHALHPNYTAKHEECHSPLMNRGPVVKHSSNLRYATDVIGASLIHSIAASHGVPLQEFVPRQDAPCGSTIGPTVSSGAGVITVDVGTAQLAMHSIREVCGAADVEHMISLIRAIYEEFSKMHFPL